MALQVFGFHTHPSAFAVTKADVTLEHCVFLLDFSRPLKRIRWLGVHNKWVGITVGLLVPIAHQGEPSGGYVFGVRSGEPYFLDIQDLWRKHHSSQRTILTQPVDPGQIIADFANHFPEAV